MKKILLFLCVTGLFGSVEAQQRTCGTMTLQQMLIQDPAYLNAYRQDSAALEAAYLANPDGGAADRLLVTVPVVVHVVYNTTGQNITDAQVMTQITAMNKDYQNFNSDTTAMPGIFKSVHGNPKISFCLAHTDPNGNYTTGIEHVHTNTTSFSDQDGDLVKQSGTGAAGWNNNFYLNIWTCNLSGGLLGYSTFPTGGVNWHDGCVIAYDAFGVGGSATYPFNKGRTVTHEVGHWFALYHIWGDDGGACPGSGGADDGISDTPPQASEHYGCPSYPQSSCNNTSDMYMNYMDYTDDACMYMFTKGQATKMNTTLTVSRTTILTSTKCNIPAGVEANELDILFSISPNPGNGLLHLYAEYPTYKNLTVEVYSMTGARVYQANLAMGGVEAQTIDLSNQPNGTYFVKVTDGKNYISKKVLVQR